MRPSSSIMTMTMTTRSRSLLTLQVLTAIAIAGASALSTVSASTVAAPSSSSSSAGSGDGPKTQAPSATAAAAAAESLVALGVGGRVEIVATIALFAVLSLLSGRELWHQHYGRHPRRRRPGPGAPTAAMAPGAGAAAAAAAAAMASGPGRQRSTSGHGRLLATTTTTYGGGGLLTPTTTAPTPELEGTAAATTTARTDDGDEDPALGRSTGAEMRRRFFVVLFLAATIRVGSLLVQVATLRAAATSRAYARILALALWLPSLLFASMFGLVLLFWAQLCYACWGGAQPWPRRVFFVANVAVYATVAVLAGVTPSAGAFARGCELVLGGCYGLMLLGLVGYSLRLIQFFRRHTPDEDFFFDGKTPHSPRQLVLRRITAVCVLLSALFAVKAVYLVVRGAGGYDGPRRDGGLVLGFAMHLFTEFVPSALLLVFTRKVSPATTTTMSTIPSLPTTMSATALPSQQQPLLHRTQSSSSSTGGGGGGASMLHMASSHKPATPNYGFRGQTPSGLYHDETSGPLNGYQYQATQRTYTGNPAALRNPPHNNIASPYGQDNHGAAHQSSTSTYV